MIFKAWKDITLAVNSSYCKISFLGAVLFLAAGMAIGAQETETSSSSPSPPPRPSSPLEDLPGLRERAVVVRIVSMIMEQNQTVWDMENTRVTIPGRPVGLQLVGADLVVAVQFTPFLRPNGRHVLVAIGQIWINVPDEGISYHTTMQTIPLEFMETVYFFPLGSVKTDEEARIEIQLTLEPFVEEDAPVNRGRGNGNPNGRSGR